MSEVEGAAEPPVAGAPVEPVGTPVGGALAVSAREREFADWLASMPAGVGLLDAVAGVDLSALTGFELVEVVAAALRLQAHAHALAARAAGVLDRHASMRPPRVSVPRGKALVSRNITAGSLAMRLQCTPYEADKLIREGVSYAGVLADTGAALADGRIDAGRARALVTRLWDQPGEVAAEVEARVLPRAPGRTVREVRQDVEQALIEVDAEHATDRHLAARDARCVSRPQVRPDGMAALWVLLPAPDAVRIDTVLDAAARTARNAGDPRTLEQLRADGLRDLVLGLGDEAAAVARDGRGVDAADRPVDDDGTASGPVRAPQTHILVTVPMSTLMGLDDGPADLAGYGPIDAVQARALAAGGTWQRLVTDELSGTVLDHGRTRYRPPTGLADHVRHRDKTCTAPGCAVPAERTDLDHTDEFHPLPGQPGRALGTTSDHNLGPGCRYHHRLKTEAGFRLRQVSRGVFEWTTPTGHTFRVRPGTREPVEHLTAGRRPPHPPPF